MSACERGGEGGGEADTTERVERARAAPSSTVFLRATSVRQKVFGGVMGGGGLQKRVGLPATKKRCGTGNDALCGPRERRQTGAQGGCVCFVFHISGCDGGMRARPRRKVAGRNAAEGKDREGAWRGGVVLEKEKHAVGTRSWPKRQKGRVVARGACRGTAEKGACCVCGPLHFSGRAVLQSKKVGGSVRVCT